MTSLVWILPLDHGSRPLSRDPCRVSHLLCSPLPSPHPGILPTGACPGGLLRSASPPCCLQGSLHLRGPLPPPGSYRPSRALDPHAAPAPREPRKQRWCFLVPSRPPQGPRCPTTKRRTRKICVLRKRREKKSSGVSGENWREKGETAKEISSPDKVTGKAPRRFREAPVKTEEEPERRPESPRASWAFGVGPSQYMKLDVLHGGSVASWGPLSWTQRLEGSWWHLLQSERPEQVLNKL